MKNLQNYLTDASNLQGGHTEKFYIPETAEDISEILREANEKKTPVTISGARTGLVGGAVPFGGYLVSLEKFTQLNQSRKMKMVERQLCKQAYHVSQISKKKPNHAGFSIHLIPTEWSCQLGGTVATNASGSRSFKYGATRRYVERLEVVLPTGEIINLKRGEVFADADGIIPLPTNTGEK